MNLNNESGRVGTYQGRTVFCIEEKKFQFKNSNQNVIYALGHQGTYEKLNLIFYEDGHWWDFGTIDSDGNNLIEFEENKMFGEEEKGEIELNLDEMMKKVDDFLNDVMEKVWEVG